MPKHMREHNDSGYTKCGKTVGRHASTIRPSVVTCAVCLEQLKKEGAGAPTTDASAPDAAGLAKARAARGVILDRLISGNKVPESGTPYPLAPPLKPSDVFALVRAVEKLDALIKSWGKK